MKVRTSIVLATYNGEEYIKKQINSILMQTVLPDELIIMDDNSKDSTIDIINEIARHYQNIKWTIIKNEKNRGYIENFVTGILKAKNELVFTCDQDDIWLENKIAESLSIFQSNDKIISLHSNTKVIDRNDDVIMDNHQGYKRELEKIDYKKFAKKINYPGMALCFKREPIQKYLRLLMRDGIELTTHDWTICFISMNLNGFFVTNKCLTLRRFTGENVALKIDNKKISNIENRINGIDLYMCHYKSMKVISSYFEHQQLKYYEKLINNGYTRKKCLLTKNKKNHLKNIKNIGLYPSIKSFVADFILIFKENKNE